MGAKETKNDGEKKKNEKKMIEADRHAHTGIHTCTRMHTHSLSHSLSQTLSKNLEAAVARDLSSRQSRNTSARQSHLGHPRRTRSSVRAHSQTGKQSAMPRRSRQNHTATLALLKTPPVGG